MDPYLTELKKMHDFYRTDRFSKMGMANALGVDRRTIRRWFQGKNPPTKKHIRSIKDLIKKLQNSAENSTLERAES